MTLRLAFTMLLLAAASASAEPMTRPEPAATCGTPKRPDGAAPGRVLVQYWVEVDGRVTDVALKDPKGNPALFGAVKSWLESCAFTPSHDEKGTALRVKMLQPFAL